VKHSTERHRGRTIVAAVSCVYKTVNQLIDDDVFNLFTVISPTIIYYSHENWGEVQSNHTNPVD